MFKDVFDGDYEFKYFSPGRINIIGEHIDYNGGFCLPMAIDKGTTAFVSKNTDNIIKIFSENYSQQGVVSISSLDSLKKDKKWGWANIFMGMLEVLKDNIKEIKFGLNIYFKGEIPTASGLSSSASISMLIGELLNDQYKLNLSKLDLVLLTQKMENTFLGAQTGILDQYAIGNGKKGFALLLDASKPSHVYFPEEFGDYKFLIISTNKTRELSESKYNQRVEECHKSLAMLNEAGIDAKHLCQIKSDRLEEIKKIINNDTLFKRTRHCITEQERVIEAAKSLKDVKTLGRLLYESHESLRDDYDVTGEHLDFIYDFSKKHKEVMGARMTGAGFGGSGIVLIAENDIDNFQKEFKKEYFEKFNLEPTFLVASSSDGTAKC